MWEYLIIRSQDHIDETWGGHLPFLNKLGKDGWDCYAVIPEKMPVNRDTNVTYHFKRWRIEE